MNNKNIKDNAITKLLNSDKETQTDFYRTNGMSVNLKEFKEQYEAKLATKRWNLREVVLKILVIQKILI